MKKIAYLVCDHGMDGGGPENVLYASYDEDHRDRLLEADKSKSYRKTREVIVDVELAYARALTKLDGIDRLVLGLPEWPAKEAP